MVNDLNNIIRSMQTLEIQSTFNNMNVLLACIQKLMEIRDAIERNETKKDGECLCREEGHPDQERSRLAEAPLVRLKSLNRK